MQISMKDKIVAAAQQHGWTVQDEISELFCVVSLSRPTKIGKHPQSRGDQRVDVYYDTMVVGICPNDALFGESMIFQTDMSKDDVMKILSTGVASTVDMSILCTRSKNHPRVMTKSTLFNRRVCGFGWSQPKLRTRKWKMSKSLMDDPESRSYLIDGLGGISPDTTSLIALGTNWVAINMDGTPRFGGRASNKSGGKQQKAAHGGRMNKQHNPHRFNPQMSKVLEGQLNGRQRYRAHVTCLSLGPDGESFFCQYADGEIMSHGLSQDFQVALVGKTVLSYDVRDGNKQKNKNPHPHHLKHRYSTTARSIALGPDDSYVCIWKDGSYDWSGVPDDLHDVLTNCQPNPDIGSAPTVAGNYTIGGGGADNDTINSNNIDKKSPVEINMGPNNEWFLRFVGGSWLAHGHPDDCQEAIESIKTDEEGMVVNIHFGKNDSWLIEYEVGEEF
jgi:hypothetical protein